MFATKEDLKNNIYQYQVNQITQGDDSIVLQALETAIDEVRSYLEPNEKREFLDGRFRYDVSAIFSATGNNRNALILNHVITIAKWYIIDLSNVDILYDKAKERYDRAIEWLMKLAKGDVNLSSLPQISVSETVDNEKPFSMGSRPKFNHE
ncbi:MAG: phage protein Gp36 family protein [Flavobacteriales bacterium]